MRFKTTALRMAGAAMITVALAPWVGAGAASASITVYLDQKWSGTDSANTNVTVENCGFTELQMPHSGQGWHFVLPGGTGLTEFTANFENAGKVAVTTTETADGVVVQAGKGAVIYTPTDDVLLSTSDFADHPGQGTAATGENDMQLSHLCDGQTPPTTTSPPPTTTSPPPTTTSSAPVTSSNPVTTTASNPQTSTTTPAEQTATSEVSVLPTKVENTSATDTAVAVEGTKAASQLPHTGADLPIGALMVLSAGLLLGGGALMLLPGLAVEKGQRRRH